MSVYVIATYDIIDPKGYEGTSAASCRFFRSTELKFWLLTTRLRLWKDELQG
jgi:hypothetical protein